MKKYLLLIGTVLLSAMLITACSDDDKDPDPDPETPEVPENPDPDPDPDPDPTPSLSLWLVDQMVSADGLIVTFNYNSDNTIASIDEYSTDRDETRTVTYTWGTDGKLEKYKYHNQAERSFVYEDDVITVVTEEVDGWVEQDPYYLVLENGKLAYISLPQEDIWQTGNETEFRYVIEYDEMGRLYSMELVTYVNGELVVDPWADGPTTYSYDDKNAIAYSGMLPDWYFTCPFLQILSFQPRLTPLNNITGITTPGMWGGTEEYGYEYNEDGYPVRTGPITAGEIYAPSAMTITYKEVEIEE